MGCAEGEEHEQEEEEEHHEDDHQEHGVKDNLLAFQLLHLLSGGLRAVLAVSPDFPTP